MADLEGKRIVVGITGGIAAYKSAELVRLLRRIGADVRVVMTVHANHFMNPLSFETFSVNGVITGMFSQPGITIEHVSLGQESDLIAIAPATANTVGKIANGIGDDFLSTLILAATCKVLLCPAMDKEMFQNAIVQANLRSLKERGCGHGSPSRSIKHRGGDHLHPHRSGSGRIESTCYRGSYD